MQKERGTLKPPAEHVPLGRSCVVDELADQSCLSPSLLSDTHRAASPTSNCCSVPRAAMTSLSAGVDNDFPDQVAATLQRNNSSKQVCAALNTAATILAVGCSDGGVALYDFETRGVAKLLKGHTAAVVALSWNATSHHLLTASLDGLIIRWNVMEGTQGAYATMGTVSTAASAITAADEEGQSKRRIKSVHLHPTITDLAILNFADHDAPMILQLQPIQSAAAASSSSNVASASPTVGTVETSPNSSAEPAPRLPLWSRLISTPFVAVAAPETPAQPETPVTPAAAAATAMSDDVAAQCTPVPAAAAADLAAPSTPSASAATAASSLLATIAENAPHYTKWHATVAIWDHTGTFIFEGNTKGTVFVYQLQIDRAQLEAARRNPPAPGQTALPSWLHLRLVYVEARPVFRDRASRSVACSIQALVLSNCSSYLMCNFSTQLKIFRVDSALLTKRSPEREATLDRMAAHCASDLESREIALNGARYVSSEWRSKKSKQQSKEAFAGMNKQQKRKALIERDRLRKQAARAAASAESANEGATPKPAGDDDEKDGGGKGGGGGGGGSGAAESKSAANSDNDDEDDDVGPSAGGSSSSGARPSQPFLEFLRSFTDPVARVPWRRCAFSHSSDFLVAGSQERGEHRIHIWSTHTGQLTKILLGPTEGLLDLVAHPFRSVLITTCTSGSIYIWQRKYVENWSAFAPDFEELEDNTEYVEKETEFDLVTKVDDPLAEAARRAEMIIDVCKEEDDDEPAGSATQECKWPADAESTLDLPPRGSAAWTRMQLISLPTIIQPDAETALAYQKRRSIAVEIARKKKQEEEAAAQAAATAASSMVTEASAAATSAKRTLEEETADANKRARI